ncbi:MAG: Threonine dehydrogenase and related Zn-dependent dehydrogenase [Frankiales bacterium]|nr:Threonine dehydrogenase and related Zn-dependent dehydrogenase [Frankiales bacterium]
MTSVRAAVLSAPRTIDVVALPVTEVPAAGAWLDVESCGVCGSDWSWYRDRPIPSPFVPGHEMVGRIGEVWGDHGNPGLRVGARVAVEEALPCGSCAVCRSGRHRLCPLSTRYGGTGLDVAPGLWGGFAERVYLAPRSNVHEVPDDLDAELATLFIPVSNGLSWLSSTAALHPGESVLVLGVGQHGLASIAAARRSGAGAVVAVGRAGDEARLAAARELGADVVVDADRMDWTDAVLSVTAGVGVDVTVDTTPAATDSLGRAVSVAAIGGRIVMAGLKSGRPSPVPTDLLVRREISVRGVAARESWAVDSALAWLTREPQAFEAFSSVTVGLDDVERALLALGGEQPGERPVHAVVRCQ